MKLGLGSLLKKDKKKDYFIALLLRDEKIEAVIFQEEEGKIQVIGEGKVILEDSIESLSEEEFLDACDKAISQAEQSLPPSTEVKKTIFGLKENWILEDKIKREYLEKLKKLSEALALNPVGFLITHDAISHLLAEEEGAPVSALLVEVGIKNIAISLLRAGKIIETKRAKIEDSISQTTDRLLHHFNYEVLPSRIIVFDGKNAEAISQEFIAHLWSKSLPFLHVPQANVLSKGFDSKAIVFGVAKQMGFGTITQAKIQPKTLQAEPEKKEDEVKTTIKKEEKEEKIQEENDKPLKENEENFGFLIDEDVAKKKKEDIEEEQIKTFEEKSHETEIEKNEMELKKPEEKKGKKLFAIIFFIFTLIFKIFLKIPFKRLPLRAAFSGASKSKIIFIPPIIILILIILFVFYTLNLKSNVTIYLTPKIMEENYTLSLSSKKEGENIIQVKTISVKEEGKISKEATGKKEVGEKAKGTVSIYNKTSESKTFPVGTIIKASNGLEFSLNEAVNVSSASGDIFSPTTPGTAKAAITALEIGKEYNLPSGTTFSIGSLNNIAAKNEGPFSGGSKKEINVASKQDYDKLLEDLPKKLQDKAKQEVAKKVSTDEEVLPLILEQKFEKKAFNKEVGEETQSLTLNATISYHFVSYDKAKMAEYLKNLFKEKGQGLEFAGTGIKYEIQKYDQKDPNNITVQVKAKASFVPKVDTSELTKKIAGKSIEDAEPIFSEIAQYSTNEISFSPNIPFVPATLPRVSKNISITLRTNE